MYYLRFDDWCLSRLRWMYAKLSEISHSTNYLKNMKEKYRCIPWWWISNFWEYQWTSLKKMYTKKYFCKLFRELDLELTIRCNKKAINFLDVTLNLKNSSYSPYLKVNNKIILINTGSNHLLSIIKELLKSIELRSSQLSGNEEIFENSINQAI